MYQEFLRATLCLFISEFFAQAKENTRENTERIERGSEQGCQVCCYYFPNKKISLFTIPQILIHTSFI